MATLSLSQVKNKQAMEVARLEGELQRVNVELSNHQSNEESLREQVESLKAMDAAGLQRQLEEAQEELEELHALQQKFQIERMEAFMAVDATASQKQQDLKKMSQELRDVKAELKALKELNPDRLRKKVDEQKKKIVTKTNENKKLLAEVTGLKNKARELKKEHADELESLKAEQVESDSVETTED